MAHVPNHPSHPHRSRLQLQPFTDADFARLISWIADARLLLQWAGPGYVWPLDAAQLSVDQRETEGVNPRRHRFRAAYRPTGEVVGHIELIRHRDHDTVGRLARVLIGPPSFRGRGLGTDMVRQAVHFGFAELGLDAVDLAVYVHNTAAVACYAGIGFRRTAHRPEASRLGAEIWAGDVMTLTRQEWKQRMP